MTSPPYWGLRDYGVEGQIGLERTPDEYVAHLVDVFREVRRVLRADGTCWLNIGDSYFGGKGSNGSSKARRTAGERGWAQSPGTVLMDTRPLDMPQNDMKPKDLVGIPWRVAFALQADGWWLRSDIIWAKKNCMPESVTDRPTRSHEYLFLLTKSARYYYDAEAVKEELSPTASYGGTYKKQGKIDASRNDAASLNFPGKTILPDPSGRNLRDVWHLATQPYKGAHFAVMPQRLVEPCIKAGTSEKGCCPVCGKRWKRVTERIATLEPGRKVLGLGEKTLNNPMTNNGTGGTSLHYIVTNNTLGWRPTCSHDAEPVPCVVLDPFSGAGTVVLVAERLGRTGVGVELNMAYCTMARERVIADAPLWNGRH